MKPSRRWRLIALAGVLSAIGALWLLHVPRRPERVFRAAPAMADWVSLHDRPAERADDLLASAPARVAAESIGLSPTQWAAVSSDPALRVWLRRLADRRVLIASVPLPSGQRAVYAISDIGARAVRLRWMLKMGALPAFQRFGAHSGRTLWTMDLPVEDEVYRIAVTFEEGLFLAVASADPRDLVLALEAYDGNLPSLAGTPVAKRLLAADNTPDRGWWRGKGFGPGGAAWVYVESADAETTAGRVEFPEWSERLPRPAPRSAQNAAPPLFRPKPFARLTFDPEWAADQLQRLSLPGPAVLLLDYVRRETTAPAELALFGGDYSGRLFGMKTPAIAMAATLRRPDAAAAALQERMDRINAIYRTAVSLGPAPDPAGPLLAVTISSLPFYSSLPTGEQAAVAFRQDRIYAATNLDSLRAILAARQDDSPASPPSGETAALSFRMNLREGAASIRNGLAVAALALMMQDRERTRATRAQLNRFRDLLLRLDWLETVETDLYWTADGVPVLRFRAQAVPANKEKTP